MHNRKMSILDEIAAQRRVDVAAAKAQVSESQLHLAIRKHEEAFGPALNVLDRLHVSGVSARSPHSACSFSLNSNVKKAHGCCYYIAVETVVVACGSGCRVQARQSQQGRHCHWRRHQRWRETLEWSH